MKKQIVLWLLLLLAAGCKVDRARRVDMTDLSPTKTDETYTYFRYTATTDHFRHLNEGGEAIRIRWLKELLALQTDLDASSYEILSRMPILADEESAFWKIHYDVRVKNNTQ